MHANRISPSAHTFFRPWECSPTSVQPCDRSSHQDSGYLSDINMSPQANVPSLRSKNDTSPVVLSSSPSPSPTYHSDHRRLNATAVALMEQWYDSNVNYPYAPYQTVQQIAQQGGIAHSQVRKWLANKRKRTANTGAWKAHHKIPLSSHPYQHKNCHKKKHITHLPKKLRFRKQQPSQPVDLQTLAEAVSFLRQWKQAHQAQKPTDFQLEYLSLQTGLPTSNIQAWFSETQQQRHISH